MSKVYVVVKSDEDADAFDGGRHEWMSVFASREDAEEYIAQEVKRFQCDNFEKFRTNEFAIYESQPGYFEVRDGYAWCLYWLVHEVEMSPNADEAKVLRMC